MNIKELIKRNYVTPKSIVVFKFRKACFLPECTASR